jgi:hypothetical protein
MPKIEIRDARDGDLPGVMCVLAESGIDGGASFTLDEAREHLQRLRRSPNFRLLVLLADGVIAGTYSLWISFNPIVAQALVLAASPLMGTQSQIA